MSLAFAAAAAAPATLRLTVARKQKRFACISGCPAPKRQRIARDPIVAAAGQGFVNWAVESPLQPDVVDVHAPCGPVLVAFRVPACALAFGEHLRVVGGCAELGGWDPVAAPSLEWAEGDNWTAAVALPPGQHAFKLVIVRSDGSPYWELGDDRSLQLPAIAADSSSSSSSSSSMAAAAAAPLMTVTCSWGNTAAMEVQAEPAQLAAAAEAAAAQAAGLAVSNELEEWGGLGGMVLDVAQRHSDASLAMVSHNVEALLASERQQLEAQQAQHAQQQRAVAEAAAAFTDAAAAVHEAQAAVHGVAAAWAADDLEEVAAEPTGPAVDGTPLAASAPAAAHYAPAAPAAPALERSAAAATPETVAPAAARSSVSEQLFHFGGSDEGPSALQLARQQLVGRLPEEAAAGLEAALRSMNGAPGSRKQRAVLASLALHGPAVPAEQLYGVGSHERHPLAAHLGSPDQGPATEEAGEAANLAAAVEHRLSLGGSSASSKANQVANEQPKDPLLRGSFPGAAAYLAAQSLYTVGGLLWSAGRAAVPKAGRRVADAAVALACTAAAAAALS